MAMTIALPPNFSSQHIGEIDPLLASLHEVSGSPISTLTCGFQAIKSEPVSMDESLSPEASSSPSSSSSSPPSYGSDSTYTELKQATNFLMIKRGHTDLYPPESSETQAFSSWWFKHPEHWDSREVLDWVFYLAETENFNGVFFRGEAYNAMTGKQLCAMTRDQFIALDQNYGIRVYEMFRYLLQGVSFQKPSPPETFKPETYGNVPDFAFLECSTDVNTHSSTLTSSNTNDSKLAVILDKNGDGLQFKVNLDGLGCYDIDVDEITDKTMFDNIDDSDYGSSSEDRSEVFPMVSDEEESSDQMVPPEFGKREPIPSCSSASSDSGCEGEDRRSTNRRRTPSSTKGNHLWEFVRDLLKDPCFNPSLLKWEDKEMGVFKFVQSEAVAQMWGRKKNNPGMTYEKLSRAMRFCRSAGYFDSVPKNGRFPKKLCFRFGQKAHGWKD